MGSTCTHKSAKKKLRQLENQLACIPAQVTKVIATALECFGRQYSREMHHLAVAGSSETWSRFVIFLSLEFGKLDLPDFLESHFGVGFKGFKGLVEANVEPILASLRELLPAPSPLQVN